MQVLYAKYLTIKDVDVVWEKPELAKWQNALHFEDVSGLRADGFSKGPAKPQIDSPAIVLYQVQGATISNWRALPGIKVYLTVPGSNRGKIDLVGNCLHGAGTPFLLEEGAEKCAVMAAGSF